MTSHGCAYSVLSGIVPILEIQLYKLLEQQLLQDVVALFCFVSIVKEIWAREVCGFKSTQAVEGRISQSPPSNPVLQQPLPTDFHCVSFTLGCLCPSTAALTKHTFCPLGHFNISQNLPSPLQS